MCDRNELERQARLLHWHGASHRKIARVLGISPSEAPALVAAAYGPLDDDGDTPPPTPDQIRDRAAEIRSRWSPAEQASRQLVATSTRSIGNFQETSRRRGVSAVRSVLGCDHIYAP